MDWSWRFIFIWASVLLSLRTTHQSGLANVARGGVACQSSYYDATIPASVGIDGNSNPDFGARSCISTQWQRDPWWMLDLRASYVISAIEVTRRTDCCSQEMASTEIRVGNSPENNGNNNPRCAVITITTDHIMTFDCNQMEGRYVSLITHGPHKVLHFCEVKVYPAQSYGPRAYCPNASCSRDYILIQNESKTWLEAQAYCRTRYTDLSTIKSFPDMITAIEEINSKRKVNDDDKEVVSEHFWIGLYEGSLTWTWSLSDDGYYGDGEAEFRNWDVDQPHENPVIQHCVGMHHTGVWKDLDCDLSHHFLCYDARNSSSPTKILVQTPMNWPDAQLYCREHHTDLLSVRNSAENQEIQSMEPLEKLAWIGLSGNPWTWSDGTNSPFIYEWQTPLPSLGEGPDCVYIHNGKWSIKSCDTKSMFLCYYLKKRSVWKISTNFDTSDPLIQQQILSQLEAKMKNKNISDFKISWRKSYTQKP